MMRLFVVLLSLSCLAVVAVGGVPSVPSCSGLPSSFEVRGQYRQFDYVVSNLIFASPKGQRCTGKVTQNEDTIVFIQGYEGECLQNNATTWAMINGTGTFDNDVVVYTDSKCLTPPVRIYKDFTRGVFTECVGDLPSGWNFTGYIERGGARSNVSIYLTAWQTNQEPMRVDYHVFHTPTPRSTQMPLGGALQRYLISQTVVIANMGGGPPGSHFSGCSWYSGIPSFDPCWYLTNSVWVPVKGGTVCAAGLHQWQTMGLHGQNKLDVCATESGVPVLFVGVWGAGTGSSLYISVKINTIKPMNIPASKMRTSCTWHNATRVFNPFHH